jgi:hypothetical protein
MMDRLDSTEDLNPTGNPAPGSGIHGKVLHGYCQWQQQVGCTQSSIASCSWSWSVSHQFGTSPSPGWAVFKAITNPVAALLQQSPIFLPPTPSLRPLQLRHALFVCKHWYNAIISDQKLWSTITIDRSNQ